jgi:hypothetical protein
MLGHESVTTTFGIYRRVNPESGRKAAAAMGAVLERVVTPQLESAAMTKATDAPISAP